MLVIAIAALLVPLTAALIGARASRRRVGLTVVASQAVFHIVFQSLGAPTSEVAGVIAPHAHVHHLPVLGPVTAAALPGATMIAGHAIAAAVTAVLFWRGEQTVRQIAGWMLALLRRAVAPLPAEHERPAPLRLDLYPFAETVVTTAVSRRGPPALA